MRQTNWTAHNLLTLTLATGGLVLAGCRQSAPPPQQVSGHEAAITQHHNPPRATQAITDPNQGRLYDDVPLMDERPPEQKEFVQTYNQIGRPRLMVFVNRTLDGKLIPLKPGYPPVGHEVAPAPGQYEPYLRPGEYDSAFARAIDYQAVETIMTDWLAANGQTMIISPRAVRQQLSEAQTKALESGDAKVLTELADRTETDVLIQVQIQPTRQVASGLEVRAVAEAINVRDGQSIARAVVDIPPLLQKTTINTYTRFLARKLMDEMTQTWQQYIANSPPPAQQQPPAPAPAQPELQPAPSTAPTQPSAQP